LARHCADPELLFRAAYVHVGQVDGPRRWDERVALAEECAVWPREGVSSSALGNMLMYSAKALIVQGERARAEELWRQIREAHRSPVTARQLQQILRLLLHQLILVRAKHSAMLGVPAAVMQWRWQRCKSHLFQRDDRGFILTGHDVPAQAWPLDRPPLPFETSPPGVFAVGDVRHESIKRVPRQSARRSVRCIGTWLNAPRMSHARHRLRSGAVATSASGRCTPV
jgi:hypothetical protein